MKKDEKIQTPKAGGAETGSQSNSMWGGRFEAGSDAMMLAINSSIDFDKAMAMEDIDGSRAHARMLARQGIISEADRDAILGGLSEIEAEIREGRFEFSQELEDIHLNIEHRLSEKIGAAGGRLHTARSRNDQVALDFRLWVRARADEAIADLRILIEILLDKAEACADVIMPGFTHLQVAQPVSFGQHLMAYVEMFGRDLSRFEDARERMNECPLGAAALAGTSFPIDREMTARELGFARPTANSMDSVADRDFALEFMGAAALCAMHMSRLAEELVIWSTVQFGFVTISDAWSTGSSIMPQKRNPDAAELVRAKVARINAAHQSLMMVMKGLPLTYSKDMQEDKEPIFDGARAFALAVGALTGMLKATTPNETRMREAAASGFSTATDLADWLVRVLDMPFREAHHVTGTLVKKAEDRGVDLSDLSLEEMQAICSEISEDVYSVLSVENSVASRVSFGGTAPQSVRAQIERWRGKL